MTDELTNEIAKRSKDIKRRTASITKELEELSKEAQTLHDLFTIGKNITLHDLCLVSKMNPKELEAIKRACRLTKNSPYVNRCLCNRFGILP